MKRDWSQYVLDPTWLERLDALARRRFPDGATAEEATTYVLEGLAENDWQRCKAYTGGARPTTFLHAVVANLIEEFARKRYGRPRPPAWLKRQGTVWTTVWRRVCLERALVPQVIDQLGSREEYSRAHIADIIRTIKARMPWCGVRSLPIPAEYTSQDGQSFDLIDQAVDPETPTDALARENLADTLTTLGYLLDSDQPAQGITEQNIRAVRQNLELEAQEVLMLRMHFRDGLSYSGIARALGIPVHLPGRRIKKTLKKLHAAFRDADIDIAAGDVASVARSERP